MHRDVIELMLQNGASLGNEKTIVDQTKDGWKPEMNTRLKKSNVQYLFYKLNAIVDNKEKKR